MIRVAIVADTRLYREGLAQVLSRDSRICVAATAARREEALASLPDLQADVVLVDMAIEVATVKNHVHNILEKLQVHRRGEAAARVRGIATRRVSGRMS